jgi:hypothetical protein
LALLWQGRTPAERLPDELLRHTAAAHGADKPRVGRILEARDTRVVTARVGAPIAGEGDDLLLVILAEDGGYLRLDLLVGEVTHGDGGELAFRRAGSASHARSFYDLRRLLRSLLEENGPIRTDCRAAAAGGARLLFEPGRNGLQRDGG